MLINKLMSNQFPTYFQILIQNICLSTLIVRHDPGFPRGSVNGLVRAETPGRRMSNFHPCQHLRNLAFWSWVPLSVSPPLFSSYHTCSRSCPDWESRKGLGSGTCQLSPCLPLPPWNPWGWILITSCPPIYQLGFFPLSLPSFFWRLSQALLILSALVFPKSQLHQLLPLFLKSLITFSLHWLFPPLAINMLSSPSS